MTNLQLKEAMDMAKIGTVIFPHGYSRDDLEKFRKRIRGKCGGMADENLRVESEGPKSRPEDGSHDDDLTRILVRFNSSYSAIIP